MILLEFTPKDAAIIWFIFMIVLSGITIWWGSRKKKKDKKLLFEELRSEIQIMMDKEKEDQE